MSDPDHRPVLSAETQARLRHRIRQEQSRSRLVSVAAGLIRDGELIFSGGAGHIDGTPEGARPDPDTQYRCGSITKTFVAVAVMQLRDAGRLELGDHLEEHVPGTAFGRARICELLSHSAGAPSETAGPWWERNPGGDFAALRAESLQADAVRSRPGRRFHYSNTGFGVLGELLARHHGIAWHEVVDRDLLRPLGMDRTTTAPQPPAAPGFAVHPFADVLHPEPAFDAGAMAPAGQLWTTVGDLARWAAVLGGYAPELLAPDTLAEMREPLAVSDFPGQPWTTAQGLGLQLSNVEGRRGVGHGGSMPGFLARLQVDTETGDGVVCFANSTSGLDPTLHTDLLAELQRALPHDPPAWLPSPVGAPELELTGTWYWGSTPFTVKALPDGGLELGPASGESTRNSPFTKVGQGQWRGTQGYYTGEPLRAVRDARGHLSHLDLASFIFTRTPYELFTDEPGWS